MAFSGLGVLRVLGLGHEDITGSGAVGLLGFQSLTAEGFEDSSSVELLLIPHFYLGVLGWLSMRAPH